MDGYSPQEVLTAVKRALWVVNEDDRVNITQVDLTLKTHVEAEAGFELKVPFLSNIEFSAGGKESVAQTIELTLAPSDLNVETAALDDRLKASIEEMIKTVKAMVEVASDGQAGRPLLFKNGAATVEFVFDAGGTIKLVFHADLRANYANTVKITFG